MRLIRKSNGSSILVDMNHPLGSGGEARVFAVTDAERLCAKIYHQPTPEQVRKLTVMVENPPDIPISGADHHSIAWPIDLLYHAYGSRGFAGFLMPRVSGMRPLFNVYNPAIRRKETPLFTYEYLYTAAINVAWAVRALHQRGYVIGDINESNILVKDTGLVTLVDTDSFQVHDPVRQTTYRCPVGKPDYTPPELQNCNFRTIDRTPEHDLFGLAVLIFQLLMEGTHPFSGIYLGHGDPPPYSERIRAGHYPYGARPVPYKPMPQAPPMALLPPTLKALFARCFEDGFHDPSARPDAATWSAALKEAAASLTVCTENPLHRYGAHLTRCPWCGRKALLGGRDPFPPEPQERIKRPSRSQPARYPVTLPPRNLPAPQPAQASPVVSPSPQQAVAASGSAGVPSAMSWPLAPSAYYNSYSTPLPRLPSLPPYPAATWAAGVLALLAIFLPVLHFITGLFALIAAIIGWKVARAGRPMAFLSGLTGALAVTVVLAHAAERRYIPAYVRTISESGPIYSVAFSPDSSTVATAMGRNEDQRLIPGELNLYDTVEGTLDRSITGIGSVTAVAYSPDGKLLANGTDAVLLNGIVRLRDAHSYLTRGELNGFQGDVSALAFSHDSERLAVGTRARTVDVWAVHRLYPVAQIPAPGEVFGVAFSNDNRLVAIASGSVTSGLPGHVCIYDLSTARFLWNHRAHGAQALSVAFSPDDKMLYSAGVDNAIRVWDAHTGKLLRMISADDAGGLNAVALSPDGTKAVTGSTDGVVRLWDMRTGQVLYRFAPPAGTSQEEDAVINAVSYAPNGRFIAAGTQGGTLYIWRVPARFVR